MNQQYNGMVNEQSVQGEQEPLNEDTTEYVNELQTNEVTNEITTNVVENEPVKPEETSIITNATEEIQTKEERKKTQEIEKAQKTEVIKTQELDEQNIIGELIDKRSLNEKHFKLKDGNTLAVLYPNPVHYEKKGKLLEINNTLVEIEEKLEKAEEIKQVDLLENNLKEKYLQNKANSFDIKFAKKSNKNKLVTLQMQEHKIKWFVNGASKVEATPEKIVEKETKGQKTKVNIQNMTSSLKYEEILPYIDIQYTLVASKIKEDIILKDEQASKQEISFTYDVGNLIMEKMQNGDMIISEPSKENAILKIDGLYMYDANGEMSNQIEVDLVKQKKQYILTIKPNKEWLEAKERVYPVIIDPSINTSLSYQDIQDTYIFKGDNGYPDRWKAHILRVGSNNKMKEPTRSLLKFTLPTLNAGDQIVSARLDICSYPDTSEWTPNHNLRVIDVHKMEENWESSTANWENMHTKYSSRIQDYIKYQFDTNEQCKFYYFDITGIVKDWYTTGNNYGVMLKEHIETYNAPTTDVYFMSSDIHDAYANGRPMVQMIYRNQTGILEYQTYHSQDIGRAGTIYTNDYNGNVVLLNQDVATPGTRFPVSIYHVYNANDKDWDYGFGKGFRLNIYQTIELVNIGGQEYAEYVDEDGTKIYFKKVGDTYTQEDNIGLNLTVKDNVFTMKDKKDNTFTFINLYSKWFLQEMKDTYGNKITIGLIEDSNVKARIGHVQDAVGNVIAIHNTVRMNTITDTNNRVIKYTYNQVTGDLEKIEYPDGKIVQYQYESGVNSLLTKAIDIDNQYVQCSYYNEKSNRVKEIKQYSSSQELGKSLSITYGDNVTTFQDNQGYQNRYTFNNLGETVSISDFGKNEAENVDEAYGKMFEYGTQEKNKHHLTLESQLISNKLMENNLLQNPRFEQGLNGWQKLSDCDASDTVQNSSLKIVGDALKYKDVQQIVNISGKKGDYYTFNGWINCKSIPNDGGNNVVTVNVHVVKNDNTYSVVSKDMNTDGTGWQYFSMPFITDADYKAMRVYLIVKNGANETYFGNLGLFKDEYGNAYQYDDDGNIISSQDLVKQQNTFTYDKDSNLIQAIDPKGGKLVYDYSPTNKQQLRGVTNSNANIYTFGYDAYGNIKNASVEERIEQEVGVQYNSHMADIGWETTYMEDGQLSGKLKENHQIEAIKIKLKGISGNIKYQTHVRDVGWQDWVSNDAQAGTVGRNLSIEAIKIQLENVANYRVEYRAYVEGSGWQDWVSNGALAGTTGQAKRLLGIQIRLRDTRTLKKIENMAEYSSNGNYQTKLVDERGNATQYTYNEKTGTLSKILDANNIETNYQYDNLDRLTKVSRVADGKTYSNDYGYENDRIKSILHNGFSYQFVYDNFGNVRQTKVGSQVLNTNTYQANNGNLSKQEYGNGHTVSYEYDRFNRITKQTGTNGIYSYTYDARSNIKTIIDSINGTTQTYTYDLANRPVKIANTNSFTSEYAYDINSNISKKTHQLSNLTNSVQYQYNKANMPESVVQDGQTWNYERDRLARVVKNGIKTKDGKTYQTLYTYVDIPNTNQTTVMIQSIKNGAGDTLSYTYDKLGNVETVKKGNQQTHKFYYDNLNQLIREDNKELKKTITYTYDTGGNILNKKEYAYTTGTLPQNATKTIVYSYTNTNWKDQLTNYNGKAITYDAIGNPLTYDGNTYTWQNGRQLQKIVNTSKNQEIVYQYNEDGIRTQKMVNGVATKYFIEGSKVIYEKTNDVTTYYTYDEQGRVIGLNRAGRQYYYIRNAQEDIIGLLDSSLNLVANYTYDSWGNVISVTDANGKAITDANHIGNLNPFRYKGYYYDTDTGFYYLQSRYYNPEWGRFINFDNYGGQVGDLLSHNGYNYCRNNPVNMIDNNGNFAMTLTALITTALTAYIATVTTVITTVVVAKVIDIATDKIADKVKEEQIKSNEKNHTVYKLRNKDTKQIDYVGRTVNPEKRQYEHEKTKPGHTFEEIASGLTRSQARGLEQIYMVEYNTKAFLNRINGISPKNRKLEIYMEAGRQVIFYLGNVVSNEALYWTGR